MLLYGTLSRCGEALHNGSGESRKMKFERPVKSGAEELEKS